MPFNASQQACACGLGSRLLSSGAWLSRVPYAGFLDVCCLSEGRRWHSLNPGISACIVTLQNPLDDDFTTLNNEAKCVAPAAGCSAVVRCLAVLHNT
eukprot:1146644-Pelagomonas_calceolata.AAC.1